MAPVFLKIPNTSSFTNFILRLFMLSISTQQLVCEVLRSQSYTTAFSFLFLSTARWCPFWLAETYCSMYDKY